ncbi:MAG: hypothetical protein B7Y47_02930 [Sphingomonas sp. 28-63-12]|nr:MAG: hypothetical protein B7Y47_02930 [Sphingomonas sp. 28-63-12]
MIVRPGGVVKLQKIEPSQTAVPPIQGFFPRWSNFGGRGLVCGAICVALAAKWRAAMPLRWLTSCSALAGIGWGAGVVDRLAADRSISAPIYFRAVMP